MAFRYRYIFGESRKTAGGWCGFLEFPEALTEGETEEQARANAVDWRCHGA